MAPPSTPTSSSASQMMLVYIPDLLKPVSRDVIAPQLMTTIGTLEKILRLLQALAQILAAWALTSEDVTFWLEMRRNFATGIIYPAELTSGADKGTMVQEGDIFDSSSFWTASPKRISFMTRRLGSWGSCRG
jgi:hypothetical protein